MKRILFTIFAGTVVFVIACADIWAQATAQISGTVKDQTGAVLPGVEVMGTQTDTGITRTAVTNETGSYVLTNLAIGPYRLEAALPGFRTFVQTGIVLQVNASPVVNPVLEVGQVTDQVEVKANAALVETRNAGVGQVMENTRILELPLNGRNVESLIVLGGGSGDANPALGGGSNPFFVGAVSVGGGLASTLNYTLDGANHNTAQDNSYVAMPFPDALEEFKVETGAMGAQNGMKSAGSVTMVTKSGTNGFHGDLFEFVRNGIFNARNAFATKRDTIKRNQFGGTVGGPIARDKLFFFAGYQGTTIRMDPSDVLGFVPTPAMEAGDFTAFASPACNVGRQITLKAPFVNNRVDPGLFSKPAVAFAKLIPSTPDPCGKIKYGNPTLTNEHQVVGRFDYQRSVKHQLFARYLVDSIFSPPSYDLNKNLLSAGHSGGVDGLAQAFTVGDTYLFRASIVNAFRLTANRVAGGKTQANVSDARAGLPDIGVKMFSYEPHNPNVQVDGAFIIGPNGGPTREAIFAASDDLSVIRGNHQLAFGTNASLWWLNSYGNTANHGSMEFNGQTTGLALADYFMGNASVFTMGTNSDQHKRSKYVALYGADIWKVNQKLTLSYGLRWEPYFPMIHLDRSAIHFDLDALRKGIKTTQFANLPPGVFFNGDPGFPGLAGMYNHWWDFSPRLGLAWDVAGDGRMSVRASVGTFYDFPSARYLNGQSGGPPWNPQVTRNNVNFADPWAGYPGGDPFPVPHGRNVGRDDASWPLYGATYAFDYDSPTMKVSQWNLSLQRQIGADWLISATYLGNGTTHLWTSQNLNPSVFLGLGPCTLNGISYPTCSSTANTDQRRRLSLENPQTGQYFGNIIKTDTGGTANYNGVVLSVQRRVTRGVTINTNYTLSHCISDQWGSPDVKGLTGQGYTNPDNRRFDRGNCNAGTIDQRHLFNLSAVADTPRFSNPTLRTVGSGWRLSTIFRILSGDYLSMTTSQDRALNNTVGQRVNQILSGPYGAKSVKNYLNPAAFALSALGTLGNSGMGSIAGPGTWQFDTALTRTFQVREEQKLEFRAEAFNLTNAFRMMDPVTNFNSSTFGQVTSAKDPRIMQFALKYVF